jgi:hypothetical protein
VADDLTHTARPVGAAAETMSPFDPYILSVNWYQIRDSPEQFCVRSHSV